MWTSRIFLVLRRLMSWCYSWSWILRLVSFGDHNIHKMPASSSFSVAIWLGLLARGRGGLAQMLLYALEKGPKEKNDNNKNAQPWEIYRWNLPPAILTEQARSMKHLSCGQKDNFFLEGPTWKNPSGQDALVASQNTGLAPFCPLANLVISNKLPH